MDVKEFKETYPKLAHLEGNDLWDAMTTALLNQQGGEEILKSIQPFWKRYKLRYLFYRKANQSFISDAWDIDTLCSKCLSPTNATMLFNHRQYCFCGEELVKIPNRKLSYKIRKRLQKLQRVCWVILDYFHICRRTGEIRYGIFGDEASYAYQTYNIKTGEVKNVLKSRRWFEYVFIKK